MAAGLGHYVLVLPTRGGGATFGRVFRGDEGVERQLEPQTQRPMARIPVTWPSYGPGTEMCRGLSYSCHQGLRRAHPMV
jgi:hypothetical protein